MLKPKIIEGRIKNKRNLGGIIFLDIATTSEDINAIVRKDSSLSSIYRKIEVLQINDYCRLELIIEGNDWVICKLLAHFKKQQDYFWVSRQLEIVRTYAFLLNSFREYFNNNGYTEVRLPTIHPGENNINFKLDFFKKNARLTSSNSLYLDIYTIQLHKAYTLQKCFRAEKSHTSRHLAEFDMLETAHLNSTLETAMEELERLLKFILNKFGSSPFAHLSPLDFSGIKEKKIPVLPYREIANQYNLDNKGLGKYEREIALHTPVFVTHFPRKIASWTARPVDETYARSFNLLLPGVGEVADGKEKQTDMKAFRKKIQAAGMEEQLGWYLRMVPYSNFLLSGFGVGVERLAMWLLGLKNIREIHPIYRDTHFSEFKK